MANYLDIVDMERGWESVSVFVEKLHGRMVPYCKFLPLATSYNCFFVYVNCPTYKNGFYKRIYLLFQRMAEGNHCAQCK